MRLPGCIALVMALGLLGGCKSVASEPEAQPTKPPCVMAETDERLGDAPIRVLMHESDVVVEARVAEIEDGIALGHDRSLSYARVGLEVDRTLSGSPVGRLDLYLMWSMGDRPICFAGLPRPSVGDSGIWMLTEMAPQFGEGYVATSSRSMFLDHGEETFG